MFSLCDYETYVRKQLRGRAYYKKEDITEKLIKALLQFEKSPGACLTDIPNNRVSEKYRELFDLSSKQKSVFLNTWFLDNYGYKHCSKCESIKPLQDFGSNKHTWNLKRAYCENCEAIVCKQWRTQNPDKHARILREYNKRNPEMRKEIAKKYRLANLDKDAAKTAKRRAAKLNATPTWLCKQQLEDIQAFYTVAKKLENVCSVKYHVDHIIPLQGKKVCGLHVPWNLQLLESSLNLSKSNNIKIDYISNLANKTCRKYVIND